jgi:DNA-binding response OmpR family regulator
VVQLKRSTLVLNFSPQSSDLFSMSQVIKDSRILIVEDNREMQLMLLGFLGPSANHKSASSLAEARALLEKEAFDLMVLDVELPDGLGYDLCRAITGGDADFPLLFISARSDDHDRIAGLRSGAEDYLVKPINPEELRLRVLKQLKRRSTSTSENVLTFGMAALDLNRQTVFEITAAGRKNRHLSPLELRVLAVLIRRSNQTVSRADLLREVWGVDTQVIPRSVDSTVSSLRRKLEAYGGMIKSVYGIGYSLVLHPLEAKQAPPLLNPAQKEVCLPTSDLEVYRMALALFKQTEDEYWDGLSSAIRDGKHEEVKSRLHNLKGVLLQFAPSAIEFFVHFELNTKAWIAGDKNPPDVARFRSEVSDSLRQVEAFLNESNKTASIDSQRAAS